MLTNEIIPTTLWAYSLYFLQYSVQVEILSTGSSTLAPQAFIQCDLTYQDVFMTSGIKGQLFLAP